MLRFAVPLVFFAALAAFLAVGHAKNITRHLPNTNETIDALLLVYHNLTHKQQVQFDAIVEQSAAGESEETLADKIHGFVGDLNGKVQNKVEDVKGKFNDLKGDVSEKMEDLGDEAKKLVEKAHGTFENASQAVQDKYHELVDTVASKISGGSNSTPTQKEPTQ
ncbi:hypothetical protein M3Y99_01726800 [Aphelenchoides fujianensis]|nr:hypothetical protein M3Y99_01726800 [Aphelenchoides fujianensis]